MELSPLYELIGKELAGELSAAEREVLLAWLAQATDEERQIYDEIKRFWQGPRQAEQPAETASAFERLSARLDAADAEAPVLPFTPAEPDPAAEPWADTQPAAYAPATRPWRRWLTAAAAVVGTVSGGLWAYQLYQHTTTAPTAPLALEERVNPRGTKSKVLLADGTTVWLNADSRLRFPAAFSGPRREVYLEGEAFFDVRRNPQQPFVIHAGTNEVRVLGTSFNVKAYGDDETVETAVVTGRVAFIHADATAQRDTIYVVPDQKVVYSKNTHELRTEQVNGRDYAAWNQRSLIFQATPLAEVAKTLARQYNVNVRFEHAALRQCRLTGRFKDQSLGEVIQLIEMTGAFDFDLNNNTLTIRGDGCQAEPGTGQAI